MKVESAKEITDFHRMIKAKPLNDGVNLQLPTRRQQETINIEKESHILDIIMKESVEIEKELRVNLHPKQQEAFNAAKKGKHVFITGQGGVGKSMILKLIIQNSEEKDRESIGVVAPTQESTVRFTQPLIHHSGNFHSLCISGPFVCINSFVILILL